MSERTKIRLFVAETPSPRLWLAKAGVGGDMASMHSELENHAHNAHQSGVTSLAGGSSSPHTTSLMTSANKIANARTSDPKVHAVHAAQHTNAAAGAQGPNKLVHEALAQAHSSLGGQSSAKQQYHAANAGIRDAANARMSAQKTPGLGPRATIPGRTTMGPERGASKPGIMSRIFGKSTNQPVEGPRLYLTVRK